MPGRDLETGCLFATQGASGLVRYADRAVIAFSRPSAGRRCSSCSSSGSALRQEPPRRGSARGASSLSSRSFHDFKSQIDRDAEIGDVNQAISVTAREVKNARLRAVATQAARCATRPTRPCSPRTTTSRPSGADEYGEQQARQTRHPPQFLGMETWFERPIHRRQREHARASQDLRVHAAARHPRSSTEIMADEFAMAHAQREQRQGHGPDRRQP